MKQTDKDQNSEEPIIWFDGEDPEMQEAIAKSQAEYSEFETAIKEGINLEYVLMKYAFPATHQGVEVEHMFLDDIKVDKESVLPNMFTISRGSLH